MDDVKPIYSEYCSFSELFEATCKAALIKEPLGRTAYLNLESLYNYKFNVWLQEHKQWEYNDNAHYANY